MKGLIEFLIFFNESEMRYLNSIIFLFLISCGNTSLDDCEKQFVQNLGITNKIYSSIQDDDRFITAEESTQLLGAYLGESSESSDKNPSNFDAIWSAYDVCRKEEPLNSYELNKVIEEIKSAYKLDSLGLLAQQPVRDSLKQAESKIREEMNERGIRYSRTIAINAWSAGFKDDWIKSIQENNLTEHQKSTLRFHNINPYTQALQASYGIKVWLIEEDIESIDKNKPIKYFETIRELQETYGEKNVNSNLILSLPHPKKTDYQPHYDRYHYWFKIFEE